MAASAATAVTDGASKDSPPGNDVGPAQSTSISQMSLDDHLREAMAVQKVHHEQESEITELPTISPIDPIFSNNPYGLNEPPRAVETAKANAAKRERELSATKRAAQNRAAQRAFRQRKEGHIQELEQQVSRYKALGEAHKQLQIENHQLREYVLMLRASLVNVHGHIPAPPTGLEITGGAGSPLAAEHETSSETATVMYPQTSIIPSYAAKRKQEVAGVASLNKAAGAKKQQIEPPSPFGPVTIGLRTTDKEKAMQNIEPRLMNA